MNFLKRLIRLGKLRVKSVGLTLKIMKSGRLFMGKHPQFRETVRQTDLPTGGRPDFKSFKI